MRASQISTPVLMLTARDDVSERVKALDAGADDYLTKPFSIEELLARVRAQLRRSQLQGGGSAGEQLELADLAGLPKSVIKSCPRSSLLLPGPAFP